MEAEYAQWLHKREKEDSKRRDELRNRHNKHYNLGFLNAIKWRRPIAYWIIRLCIKTGKFDLETDNINSFFVYRG